MVVFDFFGFVAVGGGPAGRADGGPAARSVEGGCVGPLRDVRGSAGLVLLAGRVLDVLDGEVGEIFVGVKEELGFSAELHEIWLFLWVRSASSPLDSFLWYCESAVLTMAGVLSVLGCCAAASTSRRGTGARAAPYAGPTPRTASWAGAALPRGILSRSLPADWALWPCCQGFLMLLEAIW